MGAIVNEGCQRGRCRDRGRGLGVESVTRGRVGLLRLGKSLWAELTRGATWLDREMDMADFEGRRVGDAQAVVD